MQRDPSARAEPRASDDITVAYWRVIVSEVAVLAALWVFNWWFTRP
jgi:hypothetical protein